MAHKKAGGSSRNGRDSQAKRLGVKVFGGEEVNAGQILVRQRGTRYIPDRTSASAVTTRYTRAAGKVEYAIKGEHSKRVVSVVPA